MIHLLYYTCRFRYGFTREAGETLEESEAKVLKRLPGTGLTCKNRCKDCGLKIMVTIYLFTL